jgi:hypothetical protein
MLLRCYNAECSSDPHGRLGFDFEPTPAGPICPRCQRDARKPENRSMIVRLEIIHWHITDPKGPDIGHGHRFRLACGGSFRGKRATAIASVANCPDCRATDEWKAAAKEADPYGDFPVEIDVEKGVITRVEAPSAA